MDKVLQVRLVIGASSSSPFYPLISDEEVEEFLSMNGGDVRLAARDAAISLSLQLAGGNIKERYGDVEVWSNLATYSKLLVHVINNPSTQIPNGLMPWAGGIDKEEIILNNTDPTINHPPLEKILGTGSDGNIIDCQSC